MRRRGEAEGGGQAGLDAPPAAPAVVAPVHAAVVLLVQAVRHAGRHRQPVHALAVFRVALALRQVVAADPAVARLPGVAAVRGVEDAGAGDADPELALVRGVRHQRVQDQPAAAGLPVRPRRVVAQPGDVPPARAAIVAAEQPGRLDAGVQRAAGPLRQAPHRADRRLPRGVGEALAGMGPGRAEIGGGPHRRPEPFIAAAGMDGARARIGDGVADRPGLAVGAALRPIAARRVALQDERALLRPEQNEHFRRHDPASGVACRSPCGRGRVSPRAGSVSPRRRSSAHPCPCPGKLPHAHRCRRKPSRPGTSWPSHVQSPLRRDAGRRGRDNRPPSDPHRSATAARHPDAVTQARMWVPTRQVSPSPFTTSTRARVRPRASSTSSTT